METQYKITRNTFGLFSTAISKKEKCPLCGEWVEMEREIKKGYTVLTCPLCWHRQEIATGERPS